MTLLVIGGVITSGLLLALMYRAYYLRTADRRLQETIGAVEAQDPVWRWEDLLAQRAVIPDDQNSSPHILAVAQLLPHSWPDRPATLRTQIENDETPHRLSPPRSEECLLKRLRALEPTQPLDEELAQELQAELAALAPALARARPVIDLPKGRHPVEWKRDFLTTPLPGTQASGQVASLFELEAAQKAHQGNWDEALRACRGILNVGRSIGDEPALVSQLARNHVAGMSCQSLARILAQGTPTADALLKMQQALAEEARDIRPLTLFALKAERGVYFNVYGLVADGEMSPDMAPWQFFLRHGENCGDKWRPPDWLRTATAWLWLRPSVRMAQAVYLEKMTQAIAIARLPVAERREAYTQFEAALVELERASSADALRVLMIPPVRKVVSSHQRACAKLDCARTAVAAKRYRLAQGRWPQSLDQLVPEFLEEVPRDAFGAGPLRSRRLKDGLLIYSVAPHGDDEADPLTEQAAAEFKPDVGFRLLEVDHGRKRASPKNQQHQKP